MVVPSIVWSSEWAQLYVCNSKCCISPHLPATFRTGTATLLDSCWFREEEENKNHNIRMMGNVEYVDAASRLHLQSVQDDG